MQDFGTFIITKEIVSSDITLAELNIAEIIGNGAIVEDIAVRTDSTGLAGGTNFRIKADGIICFSETVANLGADTLVDLDRASLVGVQAPLGVGTKYISVSNTVGVGTGSGVITIYLKCRKLDSNVSGFAI